MKIAVLNCGLYSDVSRAWLAMYRKHWPEQPYKAVFVTNEPVDVDAEVVCIKSDHTAFSYRLQTFLRDFYTDDNVVLLSLADYLLSHRVKHELVKKSEALCRQDDIAHCRLIPWPKPQSPYAVDGFGTIEKQSRYSLSLQWGFWKVAALQKLIVPTDSAWRMEVWGSGRTELLKGHMITTDVAAMFYHNYYSKGRPREVKWVKDNVPEDAWPDAIKEEYRIK